MPTADDAPLDPAVDDTALAALLAQRAGDLLIEVRSSTPADQLKAAGDSRSNALLLAELARCRPDDAVLSEEALDSSARLSADRVWIIDPLDGTREFGEPPRVDWAVHVALWERGATAPGGITAAAVALPGAGEVLATGGNHGVRLAPVSGGPVRVIVSRTRPPAAATHLAGALDGVLVEMGSAGAKAMAVVRGEADVYAHSGGQYEWDSAAPIAVAAAAGCHVSRLDGSALSYNSFDPYLPDLLICRPELAEAALAALASFSG